jgi:hypothetical protein
LFSIANHCGKCGENAFPSRATIAAEARVSLSTAKRAIAELESLGELLVYENDGRVGSGGVTNRYEMPKVPGWTPPAGLEPRERRGVNLTPLVDPEVGSTVNRGWGQSDPPGGFTGEPGVGSTVNREPSLNRPRTVLEPSTRARALRADAREAPPERVSEERVRDHLSSVSEGPTRSFSDVFDVFWDSYPRHEGQHDARRVWRRLTMSEQNAAIEGAQRYAARVKRDATAPRYVLSAAKWLDGKRWCDVDPTDTPEATRRREGMIRELEIINEMKARGEL